jgi:hypothetical protein
MTHLQNYTREQLIALAHERGIYPPENATDEELTVVERRLSAERGWISEPQPKRDLRQEWIDRHRDLGHDPYAAPTGENPERWECKCDPDAVWTAVWRILTPDQVRQKFAHLSKRPTPAREAQRRELRAHIAEIRAEQEKRNAALHKIDHSHIPPLRIADRYAAGRPRPTVSPRD